MSLFGELLALLRGRGETRAAQAATRDVQLPFDPPLGAPIRYAYESTRRRRGMVQTTRALEEMTILPANGGFRLIWVTREVAHSASGPGSEQLGTLLPAMNRVAASAIDRPLLFDLDEQGELLGLANMAEWRKRHGQMLTSMAETMGDGLAGPGSAQGPHVSAALAALVQQFAAQTDEQFTNNMSETPHMALHGGISLPKGEDARFSLAKPARLGDVIVNQQVGIRLDLNATGTWARISMTSSVDPADIARVARQQAEALLPPDAAGSLFGAGLALPAAIDLRERATQLVALPSGLVQRASWHREIIADGRRHRVEERRLSREN